MAGWQGKPQQPDPRLLLAEVLRTADQLYRRVTEWNVHRTTGKEEKVVHAAEKYRQARNQATQLMQDRTDSDVEI